MSEGRHGTTLRLVDANDQHSVRVPPRDLTAEQIGELERVAERILAPLYIAAHELEDGLTDRHVDKNIAALRRIVAIAGLAQHAANRLERSLPRG